jgi:hypothetical protein
MEMYQGKICIWRNDEVQYFKIKFKIGQIFWNKKEYYIQKISIWWL